MYELLGFNIKYFEKINQFILMAVGGAILYSFFGLSDEVIFLNLTFSFKTFINISFLTLLKVFLIILPTWLLSLMFIGYNKEPTKLKFTSKNLPTNIKNFFLSEYYGKVDFFVLSFLTILFYIAYFSPTMKTHDFCLHVIYISSVYLSLFSLATFLFRSKGYFWLQILVFTIFLILSLKFTASVRIGAFEMFNLKVEERDFTKETLNNPNRKISLDKKGSNLREAKLNGIKIFKTNFKNVDLSGAEFINSDLSICNKKENICLFDSTSVLYDVNFKEATLCYIDFTNTFLKNADFEGADLDNAIFDYADLSSVVNLDLEEVLSTGSCKNTLFPEYIIKELCEKIKEMPDRKKLYCELLFENEFHTQDFINCECNALYE